VNKLKTENYVVKEQFYGNKKQTVKEIYESFSGWVWVVVAYEGKGAKGPNPFIGYGFVHGFEDEWGTFYMSDLKGKSDIWTVPKENWSNVTYVEKLA
jgi:hypothetical protein